MYYKLNYFYIFSVPKIEMIYVFYFKTLKILLLDLEGREEDLSNLGFLTTGARGVALLPCGGYYTV